MERFGLLPVQPLDNALARFRVPFDIRKVHVQIPGVGHDKIAKPFTGSGGFIQRFANCGFGADASLPRDEPDAAMHIVGQVSDCHGRHSTFHSLR